MLVGNNMHLVKEVQQQLSSKFNLKDLGATHFIPRMEIKRNQVERKIWLSQKKYVEQVLKCCNMQECRPIKVPIPMGLNLYVDQFPKSQEGLESMVDVPYASAIGSLMYEMVCTRPYIFHVEGVLSRYMVTPSKEN